MVSVFEGQLTRTWFFQNEDKKHVLNLYHDTISGVRSAALDYQEIRGSLGNSSLLMDSKGHRIFFTIGQLPGFLEIKRSGWMGFEYGCMINGKVVKEVTQGVPENQDLLFQPKILESTFTADDQSEFSIAWYVVQTRRITDGVHTTVHRRFREFAELNSQIKQNMKGHHLRDVLPPLPDKPSKQFTDHKDLGFIQERIFKLENFLCNMVSIPHVANMVCMKAFLGIMDQVREFSLTFHVPTLGMSLLPSERQGENGVSPCVVGMIQKPEVCTGVLPGDSLSRINGVPLGGSTFTATIARIKSVPRPMIIHFIQVIGAAAPNPHPQQLIAHGEVHLNVVDDTGSVAGDAGAGQGAEKAYRLAPEDLLDEVATVIAEAAPTPRSTKVLFQGDLDQDPEEEQEETEPHVHLAGAPQCGGGYDGEEEVYPEEASTGPVLMNPESQAEEYPYAPNVPTLSPVEFVEVDIVDVPVKAKVGAAAVGRPAVGAASGAAVRKAAAPVVTAPTKSQHVPVTATVPAARPTAPAVAASSPAPAPAPAPVAAAPRPAPTATNPNNLGGVRARVAVMNAPDASAPATTQPSASTAKAPEVIPVTTAPAPVAVPQSAQLAKPLVAAPTPTNPNNLGGVRARVAVMNAPDASAPATQPSANAAKTPVVIPVTTAPAPVAVPPSAQLAKPLAAAPITVPVRKTAAAPPVRNRSAFDDPPSSAATRPAAATTDAAASIVRNRSAFEDPSDDSAAADANTAPSTSAPKPATSSGAGGKSSLFADEVAGFSVAPSGSISVAPVSAAPTPAPAVRPAARPRPAPAAASANTTPTVSSAPAANAPPSTKTAAQSSNLLGWD